MEADPGEGWLFDVPQTERARRFRQFDHPIWTHNKAKLIERYLYYFTWVTRHGTYIDGFAGPQRIEKQDMWSARLVLNNRPRLLRNFHLFEINPLKVALLHQLKLDQPALKKGEKRAIEIYAGDFNATVNELFRDKPIKGSEATFCLLDQRTFQCDWATVCALAKHKKTGNKIELFYFLANGWIHRAAKGIKHDKEERMRRWFGNDGWPDFLALSSPERSLAFSQRFKSELGYAHVYAFPIFGKDNGQRRTMYWMIHASDHEQAAILMHRAYQLALTSKENGGQLELITRAAENMDCDADASSVQKA
jgi:three-Cys-motif partner protein